MVIEDIVINHMAGGTGGGLYYTNYPAHADAPQFTKAAQDFHPSPLGHNDALYPYHFNNTDFSYTNNYSYAQDIDHLVPNMRLGLKRWGNWLAASNGFQGFRFDLTQQIEPWYIWEWLHYSGIRGKFAFVEYWKYANGREQQEWLDLTGRKAAIYDWNLREMFKQMCENGDAFDMRKLVAPSLLGLEPEYTIVFIDNHDTMREYDTDKLGIMTNKPFAYAYAFHSRGLPMVYWREYFDYAYVTSSGAPIWGTKIQGEINRLIKIRKKAVGGAISVNYADASVYSQEREGGAGKYKSMLVMNASSSTQNRAIPTSWISTQLFDLVATNGSPPSLITSSNGEAAVSIPAKSYRIYSTTNALNEVNAP